MEMAGIVTKTGADIITQARRLVEQIGRPIELDTDGIWCILPSSFPNVYNFEMVDGSKLKLEYPCAMLNADVHDKFTNHQYQDLVNPEKGIYETRGECSIFFEVDGPYRCMVLPASTEEGKLLKKRYAVFNFDGSLAELKGFELKRRGELELIKTFQSQVFERFLDGTTLEECYASVAEIANHWIDVIDTRGESLDEDELVDLISENRSMSRQLEDYGDQKGTSQTTARRLAEFLGSEIVKDKGLNCKFIIAEQPFGAPVTERSIPTAIWKAEPAVMKHYLRKWLKAPALEGEGFNIRNILDWDYYLDRLAKSIQKIITIPAALQKVSNPVPRIQHPTWLESKVNELNDRFQQQDLRSIFEAKKSISTNDKNSVLDIEDINGNVVQSKRPTVTKNRRVVSTSNESSEENAVRVSLTKDNFPEWLRQRKKSWKKLQEERRIFAKEGDDSGSLEKRQRTIKTVEALARDAAVSLAQNEWHIIEVRPMSSFDTSQPFASSSSGEFIAWVMAGSDSIQKINITIPRTIYLSSRVEITSTSDEIQSLRKVDRHLPHSQSAKFVYEISMPEYVFRSKKWLDYLKPIQGDLSTALSALDTAFEAGTPLITRLLTNVGCICKLRQGTVKQKNKSFSLNDLVRVDRPANTEYLCKELSYRRIFLYVRIHPKTKTGIVVLFILDGGSGMFNSTSTAVDHTRPSATPKKTYNASASSHIWIVKPNSKNAQRVISLKQCESMFASIMESIQGDVAQETEYSQISPDSTVKIASLKFVDTEALAIAGANESISSYSMSTRGAQSYC
jgi:DNA polymerase epsilon subunit 1